MMNAVFDRAYTTGVGIDDATGEMYAFVEKGTWVTKLAIRFVQHPHEIEERFVVDAQCQDLSSSIIPLGCIFHNGRQLTNLDDSQVLLSKVSSHTFINSQAARQPKVAFDFTLHSAHDWVVPLLTQSQLRMRLVNRCMC